MCDDAFLFLNIHVLTSNLHLDGRLRRVIQKLDSLKGGVRLRFLTLIFCWFLIAHWFACVWWFIGKANFEDAEDRERQGLAAVNETTWVVRIPPTGTAATGFSVEAFQACVASCRASCTPSVVRGDGGCTRMSCMANSTCDDNNMNPFMSIEHPFEVINQWLTSWYWALTMLMKMPNVGPDTAGEKAFSCLTVIVGAIFFALLLGQVTTLIMVTAKAGSQLRELLVTIATFSSSRRVPGQMTSSLKRHLSAEWQMTHGVDIQAMIANFPTQLKGDVLVAVYSSLIDCNPSFLRCSDQLRSKCSLLKPAVALKKQTIVAGQQFGATIYILMKGSLQVSHAASNEGYPSAEDRSPGNVRYSGPTDSRKHATRSNSKAFKGKRKVRMLEREGSVIPLDTIFEGPRRSPFSVFAVTQCNLLLLEADELAQLLEAYPVADANSVSLALDAEYKGLVDSLKVNRDSSPEPRGTMERTQSAPQAAARVTDCTCLP